MKESLFQRNLFLMYVSEKRARCKRFAAVTRMEWVLHFWRDLQSGRMLNVLLATFRRKALVCVQVIRRNVSLRLSQ
jgi:VanZ family protein